MNKLLEAALKYAEAGLRVLPLEPRGKRPMTSHGVKDASSDTEKIFRWWHTMPDANVGIATGRGMFVVDIDSDEGSRALTAAGVTFTSAVPCAATGKGLHYFCKGDAPNAVGLVPGVDIRGEGGYVVAAPSIHPSGRRYEWTDPAYFSKAGPPPPALLALLAAKGGESRPAPAGQAGSYWLVPALDGAAEGARDTTCTRLAGYFLGKGLPVEAVEIVLQTWAERCTPPFPSDQVTKCVTSIAKRQGPPIETVTSDISAIVDQTIAEIEVPAKERRMSATNLPQLDKMLSGGFEPGEFILLGARPGVGKTALALQIARKTAENGAPVLIVSREMRMTAIVRRLLVQVSGVHASDVKSGSLLPVQWSSLRFAADHLKTLPIQLTDAPTVEEIREVVAASGPLGLVVVDYLQLMRSANMGEGKRINVEAVSLALKALAIDYAVPVLCLSSLRRLMKLKDGTREKPEMSDLRESGALEHDGDIVMLMMREPGSDIIDFIVGKNRDGRVGELKLKFKGWLMHFEELAG